MSKYLIENLFGIEGWSIAWYGVIIAVGMVLGVILAIYRARKQGLKDDLIFDFILLALPILRTLGGIMRKSCLQAQHCFTR